MNLCPIIGTFCKAVSPHSPLTPLPCHLISKDVPRGYPCAQSAPRRRRRARRSRRMRRSRQASNHCLPSACLSQTLRLIFIPYPHRGRRALTRISDRGETHSLVVALIVHPPMFGWILYLRLVSPLSLHLSQRRHRGSSNVLRSISRAVGAVRLLRRPRGGSLSYPSQPSSIHRCLCVQISSCESGRKAYPSHCMRLGCAEANVESSIGAFDASRSLLWSIADFPRGYSQTSRD